MRRRRKVEDRRPAVGTGGDPAEVQVRLSTIHLGNEYLSNFFARYICRRCKIATGGADAPATRTGGQEDDDFRDLSEEAGDLVVDKMCLDSRTEFGAPRLTIRKRMCLIINDLSIR